MMSAFFVQPAFWRGVRRGFDLSAAFSPHGAFVAPCIPDEDTVGLAWQCVGEYIVAASETERQRHEQERHAESSNR